MEHLQILKYHYRQQRHDGLNFSKGRLAEESELEPTVSMRTIDAYVDAGRFDELDKLIQDSENPTPSAATDELLVEFDSGADPDTYSW